MLDQEGRMDIRGGDLLPQSQLAEMHHRPRGGRHVDLIEQAWAKSQEAPESRDRHSRRLLWDRWHRGTEAEMSVQPGRGIGPVFVLQLKVWMSDHLLPRRWLGAQRAMWVQTTHDGSLARDRRPVSLKQSAALAPPHPANGNSRTSPMKLSSVCKWG